MIPTLKRLFVPGVTAMALAAGVFADGRNPGSVLIYPIHQSGDSEFTIVSVTNTAIEKKIGPVFGLGDSTNVHYEWVNATAGAPGFLTQCSVSDRVAFLTPADTLSVMAACHNSGQKEGYLVVTAQDPNSFNSNWSHNHLVGSELVISGVGGIYALNAIPFNAIPDYHLATDLDGGGGGDGQLDFDGVEYEEIADDLYLDTFFGIAGSSLTLINMTGGFSHTANIIFDVWNDFEVPLSATLAFNCWITTEINSIDNVFDGDWLEDNTVHDPEELDLFCQGSDDIQTGWARIRGLNASSVTESIPNPSLLGALTAGSSDIGVIDGGHLLWESVETEGNGDFFKTGTDDPEYP